MRKPRVVDLFAGCGGMSLGFENAGFEVAGAFEYWKPAADTYRQNFPNHPIFEVDLSTESVDGQIRDLRPDVIIGGPPCQDFSSAGHRDESRGRADLTIKFMEIVTSVRPRAFVMENVSRIRTSHLLAKVKELAIESGYSISDVVLDASRCNVPQARKRYFLIGVLGPCQNQIGETLSKDQSDIPMTMRDYFGDSLPFEHYFRVPRTYSRRGVFSIDEPAMTIRGVDRPVPKGYPGHPNDTQPISSDVRTLTTSERARVQTFPSDFVFSGSKTAINQMIGNAVPVNLASFVAERLLVAMKACE